MRPPSGPPPPEGPPKPELTISPPIPAAGQPGSRSQRSQHRSRQSQLAPLQGSPHPPPHFRPQQEGSQTSESQERPPRRAQDGPKLLLSAGRQRGGGRGAEPLRRAIEECTLGAGGRRAHSHKMVQEYLAGPGSVDATYNALLEHAVVEKGRSPAVVPRTVALLKRYLFRYLPNGATLQAIDAFCARLIDEVHAAAAHRSRQAGGASKLPAAVSPLTGCKDAQALLKSLAFVRALVARQMGPVSSSAQGPRQSLRTEASQAQAELRRVEAQAELRRVEARPAVAVATVAQVERQTGAGHEDRGFLESDLFSARWTLRSSGKDGKKQATWAPSAVVTGSGGLSRPAPHPVRTLDNTGMAALFASSDPQQAPPGPDSLSTPARHSLASPLSSPSLPDFWTAGVLPSADSAVLHAQIRTVAAAKRRPEPSGAPRTSMEFKGGAAKRKPRPLFHYRPYTQQQPLRLSDTELAEVVAAVCSEGALPKPPQTVDPGLPEPPDVAASVLLKLLLDMYLAGPSLAGPLMLRLLLEMLASPTLAVRCRAFDLVLNLGVHAHLIDPTQLHPEDSAFPGDPTMPTRAPPAPSAPDSRSAVGAFEEWALPLVREMLLFLVQRQEGEESVWVSGLSCLLYYAVEGGHLVRCKVDGLDVRVVAHMLAMSRRHSWAVSVHTALVRLACNLLYEAPPEKGKGPTSKRADTGLNGVTANGPPSPRLAVLSPKQVERLGGLPLLCEEFACGPSKEARRNVFAVLFDLAVLHYRQQCIQVGQPPPSDEDVYAVGVALSLAEAPEALALAFRVGLKASGEAVRQSIVSAMQRDVSSGRLHGELLAEVTSAFDDLAGTYARPDPSLAAQVAATVAADASSALQRSSPARTSSEVNPGSPGQLFRRPSTGGGASVDAESAWATLRALLHSTRPSERLHGRCWLMGLMAGWVADTQKGLPGERLVQQLKACLAWLHSSASPSPPCESNPRVVVLQGVHLLAELLHVGERCVQALFWEVLERTLLLLQAEEGSAGSLQLGEGLLQLLSAACQLAVEANSGDTPHVLQLCDVLLRQLCIRHPSRMSLPDLPFPSLLLSGLVTSPPSLLCRLPVGVLQWPLLRIPASPPEGVALTSAVGSRGGSGPGSHTSDVRVAMLQLLMTRCGESGPAFDAVGDAFFLAVLDDPDPRLAFSVSSFLLRRMAAQQPAQYRAALQQLVFQAQQSNNEKLLENPYLQLRGLLREQAQPAPNEGAPERDKQQEGREA